MNYNILLVDDNHIFRGVLKLAFQFKGYNINEANSGESAIEEVINNNSKYDIILMDTQMPGVKGYEACMIMRDQGYNGTIIGMSFNNEIKNLNELWINNGANAYIPKREFINNETRNHLYSLIEEIIKSEYKFD